jgi:hypothetical protein
MRLTGRVVGKSEEGADGLVDVELVGQNEAGKHVTATLRLALPRA